VHVIVAVPLNPPAGVTSRGVLDNPPAASETVVDVDVTAKGCTTAIATVPLLLT
jgi:hypothetical protein